MGAAGGNSADRDCGECGARYADRRPGRIWHGPGARCVSFVRRLGAVRGGARPNGHGPSAMLKRPALVLSALFLLQSAAFHELSRRTEVVPPAKPLAAFPSRVGEWRMLHEGAIEQDERDVLRADDYLTRQYAAPGGKTASLFVAYFRSQRAGQTPHSPKNCLPGSGWSWSVSDTIRVNIAGRAQPIEINRYVVSKGATNAQWCCIGINRAIAWWRANIGPRPSPPGMRCATTGPIRSWFAWSRPLRRTAWNSYRLFLRACASSSNSRKNLSEARLH